MKWWRTVLAVSLAAGTIGGLTVLVHWWDSAVMCVLGIVAGAVGFYALRESREHRRDAYYVALVSAVLVVPALAIYLSALAARDWTAFTTWNSNFTPFVAYALATLVTSAVLAAIWGPRAVAQEETAEEATEPEQWQVLEGDTARQDEERPAIPAGAGGRG